MTDAFDFLPNGWSQREANLYADAFSPIGAFDDPVAQALFNEGYFNRDIPADDRSAIREALNDYMLQEYDVEFNDIFDWDAWREAYGEN